MCDMLTVLDKSVKEVIKTLGLLMLDEYESRRDYMEMCSHIGEEIYGIPEHISFLDAQNGVKWYKEQIAADPRFWANLKPWVIDIRGTDAELSEEAVSAALASDDSREAFEKTLGPMFQQVSHFTRENGFTGDVGGGTAGWFIGIHCTEAEATRLCALVQGRFHKAFKLTLLTMEKKFNGFEIHPVQTFELMIKWLKKNNALPEGYETTDDADDPESTENF